MSRPDAPPRGGDRGGRMIAVLGAGVLATLTTAAAAQPAPVTPDPLRLDPPPNPFLARTDAEDWSAVVQIQLLSCNGDIPRDRFALSPGVNLLTDTWQLDSATLWFPLAPPTAASTPITDDFAAEVYANAHRLTPEFALVDFGGGSAPCAEVAVGAFRATELRVRLEFLRRSWRVAFDEAAAVAVPWWEAGLPDEAAAALQPQLAVPYDPAADRVSNPAKAAIHAWTNGIDPRTRLGPALLAKFLTARVVESIEPTRPGTLVRTGLFAGFDQRFPLSHTAAWDAILRGQGTEVEIAAALAAVLREAGIPARLVFGVIAGDDDERRGLEVGQGGTDLVTAWVEFYLYDEPATRARRDADGPDAPAVGGWIPVDPIRQRTHQSSKTPPLDRPWQFFGNNEAYDLYVPLAFHAHPLTTAAWFNYPALYGWQATPGVPLCGSAEITIEVDRPKRRGPDNSPAFQVGR